MSYDIDTGALAPALEVVVTSTTPIQAGGGYRLIVTDESGNAVFTDPAPSVVVVSPTEHRVAHTWQMGQTDAPGLYSAQVAVAPLPGAAPVMYPATALPFTIGMGGLAPYATLEQARAGGATGTDDDVRAALLTARRAIDRFTGDTFAPTRMQIISRARPDGTVLLPRIVRAIDTVRALDSPTALAAGSWRAESSRVPGGVDAVKIGGRGLGDPLILGAEPWAGGWNGFAAGFGGSAVEVVGTFGWDSPPPEVVAASVTIAASVTAGTIPPSSSGLDTDDDGNVVRVTVGGSGNPGTGRNTTGLGDADAMLSSLVRSPARFGAML